MDSSSGEYHWRETFFIFFSENNRPTLMQIERVLGDLNPKFDLQQLAADDDGLFESVSVHSPDDHSAMEITLELGEAVIEQRAVLGKQLKGEATAKQLAVIAQADARLDVMHFEHISADWGGSEESLDDMLDPGSLLLVVDALVKLTRGVPVDPASGAILP